MRLTHETLIKIARDTAAQRAKISRRIICIYLTGSVADENPLIGGTTDIDLVIIQDSEPLQPREIVRLTDELHLDIAYFDQSVFHHPRHLRTDPWLGPFIYKKPLVLHDTQHWFDFIQASTGAQFLQPEYTIQRALKMSQAARQGWMDLELGDDYTYAKKIVKFLQILQDAGNALVSLSGAPITERRFFQQFPQRLQILNNPALIANLIHLLVPEGVDLTNFWAERQSSFHQAYQTISTSADAPVQLHACRLGYFEKAISAIWEENPTAALWLLLRIWTQAASEHALETDLNKEWNSALHALAFDEELFFTRLQNLDTYLDEVEETLEIWARNNGVPAEIEI